MAFIFGRYLLNIGLCGVRIFFKIPLDLEARRIWFVIGEVIYRAIRNDRPMSHFFVYSFGTVQYTVSFCRPHWTA